MIVTTTAKNALTAIMKKYRLSTRAATVEAWSGNNGMVGSMCLRYKSLSSRAAAQACAPCGQRVPSVPAPQHQNGQADPHDREDAGRLHEPHDRQAVLAALRVVVETGQQQLVHGAADLAVGGVDERQPQIARAVLDAVEVVRQPAVGRRDHDPAGVRVLIHLGVVRVAEPDGARQLRDRVLAAGQEMPAALGARRACSARCRRPSCRAPAPASRPDRSSP